MTDDRVTKSDLANWKLLALPLADIAFWPSIVVRLIAEVRQLTAEVDGLRQRAERAERQEDGDVLGMLQRRREEREEIAELTEAKRVADARVAELTAALTRLRMFAEALNNGGAA